MFKFAHLHLSCTLPEADLHTSSGSSDFPYSDRSIPLRTNGKWNLNFTRKFMIPFVQFVLSVTDADFLLNANYL